MRDPLTKKVMDIAPSGIRKFFDIANTMKDVISLGVGEPDFPTPWEIRKAGILSLEAGKTRYTANRGLEQLREEERTTILYEAPHHLKGTIRELLEALGDRKIVFCRELTKKFEEARPFTLSEAAEYYADHEPRGEYVLVLAGADPEEKKKKEETVWKQMSIEEHMAYYESQGTDHKEAMKLVAKDRGVPKREIYRALIKA